MLRDAIDRLGEQLELVELPSRCVEFLRSLHVPEDIVNDLSRSAVDDWIAFGRITLLPLPKIIEENEGVAACVKNGVVALAAGLDGSPIVLDPRDRKMYFVEFPKLLGERWLVFWDCTHPAPYRYDDFWIASIEDPAFPQDFYEAQRCWPVNDA